MQEERENVGGFIDQLRSWLTESVSRTDIDADENRCRAGMCILKGGGKLIAVSRNDAIVVISGRNQGCRIVRALTNVVVWRVSVKRLEIFWIVRRAVVGNPGPADCKLVKTQHVHYADAGQGRAK